MGLTTEFSRDKLLDLRQGYAQIELFWTTCYQRNCSGWQHGCKRRHGNCLSMGTILPDRLS